MTGEETPDTPTGRLIAALRDPAHMFTSDQMAHVLDMVLRWAREDRDGEPDPLSYRAGWDAGYRVRVAEENAAYPPAPFGLAASAGQDAVKVHRQRVGVDSSYVRDGDYKGGPVPEW